MKKTREQEFIQNYNQAYGRAIGAERKKRKLTLEDRLRIFYYIVCILFFPIILSGCGKENNSYSLGIDGCVYVAEQVSLPEEAGNFKIRNGYLYWLIHQKNGFDIRKVPVEECFGLLDHQTSRRQCACNVYRLRSG